MLIRVLSYIIFAKLLMISQCAPKLGPVLFDPLTLDASDSVNELPSPVPIAAAVLRSESKPEEDPGRLCQGYDYDGNNCKLVNNRILCGYNKNVDKGNKELTVDMGNGCHMRGDRIECGYKTGPFEGIRRPPPLNIGKEAMRYNPMKIPKNPILMKLKSASLKITPTERNLPKKKLKAKLSLSEESTSEVLNENFNETNVSDTSIGISKTDIKKVLIVAIPTTLIKTSDSSLSTVTPPSNPNSTTSITLNDSSTSVDILESTTEKRKTIDSKTSTIKEKTDKEFTLSINEETKIESSSITREPTVNKIRIKRRNSPQNKSVTLCVEKQDRIVCYDDHFILL